MGRTPQLMSGSDASAYSRTMQFAPDDFMTRPYSERQLIVVEPDEAVEAVRQAETTAPVVKGRPELGDAVLGGLMVGGLAGAAAAAGVKAALRLWKARRRAEDVKLDSLVVRASQATNLGFPNGHPLAGIVYAGDPGLRGRYYPVASFHRLMFESKVAEALRLVRSLGATEIAIEYLEGFDRGAGIDLSGSVPLEGGVEAGASGSRTKKEHSRAKSTMQLSPAGTPYVPDDLVWFGSEPLWQEVAAARLESGLRAFTIDVSYTEDLGVNAALKAKIAKVGLDVGGKFTEYQETIWKLSGTFTE